MGKQFTTWVRGLFQREPEPVARAVRLPETYTHESNKASTTLEKRRPMPGTEARARQRKKRRRQIAKASRRRNRRK